MVLKKWISAYECMEQDHYHIQSIKSVFKMVQATKNMTRYHQRITGKHCQNLQYVCTGRVLGIDPRSTNIIIFFLMWTNGIPASREASSL